MIPNR